MLFRKKRQQTSPRANHPSRGQQPQPARVPHANETFQQNAQYTVKKEDMMIKKQTTSNVPAKMPQKMSPKPAAAPTTATANRRANIPGYGNPHKTMAPRDVRDSRKLVVGREISLNGEINTCDHLVVEGTVKATITGGQMLEIAHRGLFQGTVEIQEAVIAGTYEGDLKVLDRLFVKSTGVIKGNIEYGEMEVESGARIDGTIISMGGTSTKKHANDEADEEAEKAKEAIAEDHDEADEDDRQFALA